MERQQALKILNALANGVHPATGQVFAADSLYQHPDTVRALFAALGALSEGTGDSERKPRETAPNTFVRWTAQERSVLRRVSMQGRRLLNWQRYITAHEPQSKRGCSSSARSTCPR